MHISSLPGPYGIGEIGRHARMFIDRMRDMTLAVWQFLPTGPTAYGNSPYQPLSSFAGNEMLIDIGDLVERGLLDKVDVVKLAELPKNYVDYGALIPVKNRLLTHAAQRFEDVADDALKAAYRNFLARHDTKWLHDYALFRILKTRHGDLPWTDWQPGYVHRDAAALRDLEASAAQEIESRKIIQFFFDNQWHALRDYARQNGILLFGDMPIYIALDSADAWANRELLQVDEDGRPGQVAGVPPDYFSEAGQLWGNPLYAWDRHAESGYSWWIDRLRRSARLVDLVRIDHFRGFEAYWSIPAGSETAKTGEWRPGPGCAIFDAMQDALGELPIVAEDLGVITPAVEALRDHYHFPGMRVLQFDVAGAGFELSHVADNSICYTGTHDNDTTIGWFHGSADDLRTPTEIYETQLAALRITGGHRDTIHHDMIRAAFSTDARIAIVPLQDYLGLGSEARLNTPGTCGDNWRWRVATAQLTDDLCDNIASIVKTTGRTP